jgi:hypothetical protein
MNEILLITTSYPNFLPKKALKKLQKIHKYIRMDAKEIYLISQFFEFF